MTNKLVVIINSLKVPKIKKMLLYEMKFLVPNYSCLQNPWLGGLPTSDPHSQCPLSSTEFVETPPRTKFLDTPLNTTILVMGTKQAKKSVERINLSRCSRIVKRKETSETKVDCYYVMAVYRPLEMGIGIFRSTGNSINLQYLNCRGRRRIHLSP